jgi:hypothetical protein
LPPEIVGNRVNANRGLMVRESNHDERRSRESKKYTIEGMKILPILESMYLCRFRYVNTDFISDCKMLGIFILRK